MENSPEKSKSIRRISAHLCQLHLDDYLKSRSFTLFCEAYDIDDIWGNIVDTLLKLYAAKGLKFNRNDYPDERTDNLFKKLVITTYSLKKEKFAEIVPEFLRDYSKWSEKFYSLDEPTPVDTDLIKVIGEDLLDLGFDEEDVFCYFSHSGFDLKSILEFQDPDINQQDFTTSPEVKSSQVISNNRKIFIVHGHDEKLKNEVEQFLKELELEPIILHKQADRGKTIIEKVEYYSDVGFAVILLSYDDRAAKHIEYVPVLDDPSQEPTKEDLLAAREYSLDRFERSLKWRARQNVIFEFGYFIGKLGRNRVAALCEERIERPSDIDGLLYTPIDKNGEWKQKLAKEIDAAGISIADFLPQMKGVNKPPATESENAMVTVDEKEVETEEEEKGIWDFVVDGEKSMHDITECIDQISNATQEIGKSFQLGTAEVQKINKSGVPGTASRIHKIATEVAMNMIQFAQKLEEEQPKLHKAWESFDENTSGLVKSSRIFSKDDKDGAIKFRSNLDALRTGIHSSLNAVQEYQKAAANLKGISKDINRASKRTTHILDLLIADLEGADSFCVKTITQLSEKIDKEDKNF